jgi:HAD superfamily hydrolase (TIGR01509 family)
MANAHPMILTAVPTLAHLKATYPTLKALFFDMDGTLLDSEKYHTQAFLKIGKDHKIVPPHSPEVIHSLLVGRADHLVYEVVKHWPGFPAHWTARDFVDEKNKNLLSILKNVPVEAFLPKAIVSLLLEAKNTGMTLALVTSSEKVVTEELLRLGNVREFFSLVITRDDCPKHKPDPYPYLKALEHTKHEASEVLIFEDSEVGIEAAKGSGAHVMRADWHPKI